MTNQKTNWISLIGVPNSGKSTLLNKLVGCKLAIVSPKVQTTRTMLKGIKMADDTQLVFIDTPGIFQKAKTKLEKHMLDAAWNSLGEVEKICLVMDCTKTDLEDNQALLNKLKMNNVKCSLLLNKIDLINKQELLPIVARLTKDFSFENVFMISAYKGDGLSELEEFFVKTAKSSPWHYDPENITDAPLRYLAAEIVREKIFLNTDQEIPYSTSVIVDKWEETEHLVRIDVTINVIRESHKKMIIGQKGLMVKKIGTDARIDIERMLEKKVFLSIFVKVTNWHNDMEEMIDYI